MPKSSFKDAIVIEHVTSGGTVIRAMQSTDGQNVVAFTVTAPDGVHFEFALLPNTFDACIAMRNALLSGEIQ